jgi:hypothetical protein
MGLKIFKIGDEREALELKCDSLAHGDEAPTVWLDCGSHAGNLELATTCGWRERRNANGAWLCPQCVQRNATRRCGSKNAPKQAVSAHRDLDAA